MIKIEYLCYLKVSFKIFMTQESILVHTCNPRAPEAETGV